jgi:hypothetical protein
MKTPQKSRSIASEWWGDPPKGGMYLPKGGVYLHRRVECTYRRVECTHRRVECTYRRVECTYRRVECTHRRVELTHRRVELTHRRVELTHMRAPVVFIFLLSVPQARGPKSLSWFDAPGALPSGTTHEQPPRSAILPAAVMSGVALASATAACCASSSNNTSKGRFSWALPQRGSVLPPTAFFTPPAWTEVPAVPPKSGDGGESDVDGMSDGGCSAREIEGDACSSSESGSNMDGARSR